jgi:hypothetical protein
MFPHPSFPRHRWPCGQDLAPAAWRVDIVSTAKGFGCAAVEARTQQETQPSSRRR